MAINEALRLIRIYNDYLQYELADEMNVHKARISALEHGLKITEFVLSEYSKVFQIPEGKIKEFALRLPKVQSRRQKLRLYFEIMEKNANNY